MTTSRMLLGLVGRFGRFVEPSLRRDQLRFDLLQLDFRFLLGLLLPLELPLGWG